LRHGKKNAPVPIGYKPARSGRKAKEFSLNASAKESEAWPLNRPEASPLWKVPAGAEIEALLSAADLNWPGPQAHYPASQAQP
jgi:hypothetical protein